MNDPQSPPPPRGFLGRSSPPVPGYESGRRLIAECDEFKLFELREPGGETLIEWAEPQRIARLKAMRGFQKDSGINSTAEKAEIFHALLELFEFSKEEVRQERSGGGSGSIALRLHRTLGKKLVAIADANSDRDAKDIEAQLVSLLTMAIRGFTTFSRNLPDGRRNGENPTELDLFEAAEFLIHEGRSRPDKSTIRGLLEATGKKFTGKNVKDNWDGIFTRTGFERLPDFPAFV